MDKTYVNVNIKSFTIKELMMEKMFVVWVIVNVNNSGEKMCKVDIKNGDTRIDPCMRNAIENLRRQGVKTLACCCGHKKYPMTIIIDIGFSKTLPLEIFSGKQIETRKKKFYKRDKQGVYYIPETLEVKK